MIIPPHIQQRRDELKDFPSAGESALLPPLRFLCGGYDLQFCFQMPLLLESDRWIISDFFFPLERLVVEIDGSHHRDDPQQHRRDRDRDERLKFYYQIETVRFTNEQVREDTFGVAISIVDRCLKKMGRTRKETAEHLKQLWQQQLIDSLFISPPNHL